MSLDDLTQFYADLLAYEYRGRVNATAQMKLFTKQALGDFLAESLTTVFDVDTAIGKQLDIIGKYVGVPRNIGTLIAKPYFGLWTYASTLDPALYQGTWIPSTDTPAVPAAGAGNAGWWYGVQVSGTSTLPIAETFIAGDVLVSDGTSWSRRVTDNANGLGTYADLGVNSKGIFYSYNYAEGQNSDLTDTEYRTVIKLKILLNSNDATLATISQYLWDFFGPAITVIDNADMSLTYFVYNTIPISEELLNVYLPRPMGCGISIVIIVPPSQAGGQVTTEDGTPITTEQGSGFTITTENP
jgi:hypothetical protein